MARTTAPGRKCARSSIRTIGRSRVILPTSRPTHWRGSSRQASIKQEQRMRVLRDPRPGVLQATPGRSFFWIAALAVFVTSTASAQTPRVGGTAVIAGGSDLQSMNSIVNTDAWTKEFNENALFLR